MKLKISKCNLKIRNGFTLIEVIAALMILSLLLTSVMVVTNQITGSMIDLSSQTQAFNIARQNMEELLCSSTVSDKSDFGILETNPDITWQTVIEPFYEPISKRMWIRGICTAAFTDSKGERQTIELSCWLTGLTAQQIRQILTQQKKLEKLMEEFAQTEYGKQVTEQHQINMAYLRYKGFETEGFKALIEQLERRRIDYIAQYGIDEGYFELAEELNQEEFDFLYRLGAEYNELVNFFDNYDPRQDPYAQSDQNLQEQSAQNNNIDQQNPPTDSDEETDTGNIQLPDNIPDEIRQMLEKKS